MSGIVEYRNDTMPFSMIEGIVSLITLMSAHFIINSFTIISDLGTNSLKSIQELTSKNFLEINHRTSVGPKTKEPNENLGYIVVEKPEIEISQVINTKAKLIVAVYANPEPPEFFSKLVFPPSTSFFVVLLLNGTFMASDIITQKVTADCFRLYKPVANIPLKMFHTMSYRGEEHMQWYWIPKEKNWNFFKKETRNMTGIKISIALASTVEKDVIIDRFWKNKNSFFWTAMAEHLKFQPYVNYVALNSESEKSTARIYMKLLMTNTDGLSVLPVISAERSHFVDFVLTGCDSKYHLLVKAPQYVISWQSIFKPFAPEVWICLGITILLISVTLRIVTHREKRQAQNLSGCCLMIFGFVCFQGSTHIPNGYSARLVCYIALGFSILMYQYYTSNFYFLLSTKKVKLPFTNLEQFMAKRTHNLYIHRDTAMYAYILKAKSGIFKRLWDEFLSKDPSHQLERDTRINVVNNVCKGKGVILGLPFQTIYLKEWKCELVSAGAGYFPTNVVSVLRKDFPFKSQFKFVHLRLLESGVTHKFRDEFLSIKPQLETKTAVTNEPVSFEHVAFLIGFQAAFIIFSLLILFVEILISKTKRINKARNNSA